MKTTCSFFTRRHVGMMATCLLLSLAVRTEAQPQPPVIQSIQTDRDHVVVTVQVPSGIRRVTLESRERLGARSWEPRDVARLDGTGGTVTFRLPRSRQLELLRVRGDTAEALPASFYTGTNTFFDQPGSASDDPTLFGSMLDTRNTATPGTESGSREVVESDIWKFRGQTLYFFNQYRGLQIIDLTNPDTAVLRGTLELPAAGEQMYVLGADYVVLLARDGCSYDSNQVLIIEDQNGSPNVVARLPVTGQIRESRMVGTALYVASQLYRPVVNAGKTTWEWGTLVTGFDLADPVRPVARNTLWYSGYGHVVAATDTYLFVVTQHPNNWWQSTVRLVDITAPDGTLSAYGSLITAGRVADKFKLNYVGGIFTTISEDRRTSGSVRLVTKLETYRLPDPRSMGPLGIVKLGELELGRNESLRATRFDGNRVYVVTFFMIDPLWVVDLSDPARPRITGEVEVPGWSTYIEPLGDRLVTVGVENSRVAVSLFDVGNPARPTQLSRVLLGERYSWTEANYNEKAFTVLPGAGLVLVPFNGDFTNRYGSAVQLIDLERNRLVARGRIEGGFQFRRATMYTDRILSLSGWELLTVDATDRDQPVVRGRLPLAWTVDRVVLTGNHLIEVSLGSGWDNFNAPLLRVAPANAPEQVLTVLALTNLPIVGVTERDGRLYVAQGQTGWGYPIPLEDATTSGANTNPPNLVVTVIGLDDLPTLTVLGQTAVYTQSLGWGSDWQAVWPKPNVLVWSGGGGSYWWWWRGPILMPLDSMGMGLRVWPPYWGGTGGRLLAFDVSDPAAPQFASEVNLTTNNWWSFSKAYTAEGLIYVSHQTTEYLEPIPPPTTDPSSTTGTVVVGPEPVRPIGTWVQRSFLNVVDYADPREPLRRKPVSIPGALAGISHQGNVLYTTGPHWTNTSTFVWTEYLDAVAYDGVSAHLVDSMLLPSTWPHPVQIIGINILLGRPGTTVSGGISTPNLLENWVLNSDGKFERLGSVPLASPASVLADIRGLLAVQETDNAVDLFVIGNATALHLVGRGKPAGCWWFDLNRADGDALRGLWLPLGAYGVGRVEIRP